MYLDVPNGATSNIYPVIQYPYNGSNNQLWYLNRYSGDVYGFTPTHRPYSYLNVYMAYTAYGTNIGVYGQSAASANSKWRVKLNVFDVPSSQFSGSYRLIADYASPRAATAVNAAQSAPIQLWDYTDNSGKHPQQGKEDEWLFFTANNTPVSLLNEHYVGKDRQLGLKFASNVPQAYKLNILQTAGAWNGQHSVFRDNSNNQYRTDITVEMFEKLDTTTVAETTYSSGKIRLNRKYFNEDYSSDYRLTEAQRKKTCAHELGHALGLSHQYETYDSSNTSTRKRNVMKQGITHECELSNGDKASYELSWRKY